MDAKRRGGSCTGKNNVVIQQLKPRLRPRVPFPLQDKVSSENARLVPINLDEDQDHPTFQEKIT